jgi:hypothetical protein
VICGIISVEKKRGLAELGKIISGQDGGNGRMASPVLPMNRYRYGFRLKAASSSRSPKRIVLHPERQRLDQERSKRLAELSRFIKG